MQNIVFTIHALTLTAPCNIETGKKLAGIELRNKRKFSFTLAGGSSFSLKNQ